MAFLGTCAAIGLVAIGLAGDPGSAGEWAAAIGTVGAIVVAILVPRSERAAAHRREQQLAQTRIAAPLRTWLSQCAGAVSDLQSYYESRGAHGRQSVQIPPIDVNFSDVALMRIEFAKRCYSIIEQRSRAIDAIYMMGSVGGPGDDEVAFYREMAKLFRRVRKLYRDLAFDVGLHPYTVQDWELMAINEAAVLGKVKNWEEQ